MNVKRINGGDWRSSGKAVNIIIFYLAPRCASGRDLHGHCRLLLHHAQEGGISAVELAGRPAPQHAMWRWLAGPAARAPCLSRVACRPAALHKQAGARASRTSAAWGHAGTGPGRARSGRRYPAQSENEELDERQWRFAGKEDGLGNRSKRDGFAK
jgi:hypothetical protein